MLANRLKYARMASGLSQRGLVESVGISHNAIKKIECACNRFAGAFLLPMATLIHVLGPLYNIPSFGK